MTEHYATHGLPPDGGEQSPWFRVRIGPATIPLPNPPARRKAVFFHDVDHIVTGYNTVFSDGEMVIAGFEIRVGCGPFAIAWFINFFMFALGLLSRPHALFDAFVRARGCGSIYRRTEPREALRAMTVGQLRELLFIPSRSSPATAADRIQFVAWSAISWGVALTATAAAVAAMWGGARVVGAFI